MINCWQRINRITNPQHFVHSICIVWWFLCFMMQPHLFKTSIKTQTDQTMGTMGIECRKCMNMWFHDPPSFGGLMINQPSRSPSSGWFPRTSMPSSVGCREVAFWQAAPAGKNGEHDGFNYQMFAPSETDKITIRNHQKLEFWHPKKAFWHSQSWMSYDFFIGLQGTSWLFFPFLPGRSIERNLLIWTIPQHARWDFLRDFQEWQ